MKSNKVLEVIERISKIASAPLIVHLAHGSSHLLWSGTYQCSI